MKAFLTLFLSATIGVLQAQDYLNVMSFNIRLNIAYDSLNAWPYRKDKAASQILYHETDLLGVQEALHDQMEDLQQRLPGFGTEGVGRSDGKQGSEYSAIFYKKSRLQKLAGSTFWLSATPTVAGSKGWDADYPRIVTWARFKDLKTKKEFYYFNTHFDHIGQEARRQSAHMLLTAVDSIAGKLPVIISGDFNAKPEQEPIRILTNTADPLHFTDTKAISKEPHFGPAGTFNAFQAKEVANEPIDHIFIKGNIKVLKHATLAESWEGRFSSDHFPVISRLLVEGRK